MKRKFFLLSCCAVLIFIFLYTGFNKLRDYPLFSYEMHIQPIPTNLADFVTSCLPIVEILTGLSLLFLKTRIAGIYSSIVLNLTFTVYAISILLHAFDRIPCACGGIIRLMNWKQHLALNAFLLGISITAFLLRHSLADERGKPKTLKRVGTNH